MKAIFKEVISLADNMKSALICEISGRFSFIFQDIGRLNIGFTW